MLGHIGKKIGYGWLYNWMALVKVLANEDIDVVFCIDNTGSMVSYIDSVKENIEGFLQALTGDYRVGIITYKDNSDTEMIIYNNHLLYTPAEYDDIVAAINGIVVVGGGDRPENLLDALEAASQFDLRVDIQTIFIFITDTVCHEDGLFGATYTDWTVDTLISTIIEPNDIWVYPVYKFDESYEYPVGLGTFYYASDQYEKFLPTNPNGKQYDITEGFESILEDIAGETIQIIAPTGWILPTNDIWNELIEYTTETNEGGDLKSTRNEWLSPNTGATNKVGLEGLPGGGRSPVSSEFLALREVGRFWSATQNDKDTAYILVLMYNSGNANKFIVDKRGGGSVRLVMEKLDGEVDGDRGTLTDIDGNVYNWLVIGNYRWMLENLRVTKYNDGTLISEVSDDTQWRNLVDGGRCAYDNDLYYVYPATK
jgi:uncharacterized protein (TIGR02145 family)